MRKLTALLALGTLALALSSLRCDKNPPPSPSNPYERTVLAEVFTNVNCPNCPVADAYIDSLVQANPAVVAVKYHSPRYPFPDPFINDQVDLRESFYFGNTDHGYPYVYFDGVFGNEGVSGIAGWGNQIRERREAGSPVNLALGGTYHAETHAGTLQVYLESQEAVSARLFAVAVESGLTYEDETYDHVFRAFVGDPQGRAVTAPDTVSLAFEVAPEWNPDEVAFVVFFQDPDSREVLQAARIPLSDLGATTPPEVFRLTPESMDTLGPAGHTLSLRFYLKNVGQDADSAWVELRGVPDPWVATLCIGDMCLPRPSGYTHRLSPGDSVNLDVDLYVQQADSATLWLFTEAQIGRDRDSARIRVIFNGGR